MMIDPSTKCGRASIETVAGVTHSKKEGLNILRSYLSLVLGHSGGARRALDLSLAVGAFCFLFLKKEEEKGDS